MMDLFIRNRQFLLHKVLIEGWSHVDYCDVLISCLDSHSDGTHSLQRTAEQATFLNFSKSVEETNSPTARMA